MRVQDHTILADDSLSIVCIIEGQTKCALQHQKNCVKPSTHYTGPFTEEQRALASSVPRPFEGTCMVCADVHAHNELLITNFELLRLISPRVSKSASAS